MHSRLCHLILKAAALMVLFTGIISGVALAEVHDPYLVTSLGTMQVQQATQLIDSPAGSAIAELPQGATLTYCYQTDATYVACFYGAYFGFAPIDCLTAYDNAHSPAADEQGGTALDISLPVVTVEESYTYEQMLEDLILLQALYPEHFSLSVLAETVDDRYIVEVTIGNVAASKHILIQASIHGREYINTLIAMKQIEDILQGYDTASYEGVAYSTLFEDYCFHIIPMANPDGVTISQKGIEGIRSADVQKTLRECYKNDRYAGKASSHEDSYYRRWKANARGVDLNRNFDSNWGSKTGVYKPSSEKFKGEAPASEIETRAILSIAERHPVFLTIAYHSKGQLIYWDYGTQGSLHQADKKLMMLVRNFTDYKPTSSVQTPADGGGCSDYFMLEKGVPSITIENGYNFCPVPMYEWKEIWEGNQYILPAVAKAYYYNTELHYPNEQRPLDVDQYYSISVDANISLKKAPRDDSEDILKLTSEDVVQVLKIAGDYYCKVMLLRTGDIGYVLSEHLY